MKTWHYLLFCWAAAGCAMMAQAEAKPAMGVDVTVKNNKEIIAITAPGLSPNKVFTLENPDRLVVDVPAFPITAQQRKALKLPDAYDGRLLKSVRFGQFDPGTMRFVFDLEQPVDILSADDSDGELLVTVRSVKPMKSGASGKPVIVIDPGHGGADPGAVSAHGIREKNLVLEYAKMLKKRLEKNGKYRVVLTRDDDTFIRLRERIAIAKKEEGALFISLHADSAPDEVRGLSVYTLSEESSDEEAEALAQRENKSDILPGMDLSEEREDVAGILISLAQRETKNRSATLADFLLASLGKKIRLLQHSHRFAGFAVLKAPDIPSVLIELGFLSHPRDEKLLRSNVYRDRVVAGIASGIDAYFRHKKRSEGK